MLHTETGKSDHGRAETLVLINEFWIGRLTVQRGRPIKQDPATFEYDVKYHARLAIGRTNRFSTKIQHAYHDGAAALLAKCFTWAATLPIPTPPLTQDDLQ